MTARIFRWLVPAVVCLFLVVPALQADTIQMKNGDQFAGIILKIDKGVVTVEVNRNEMTLDILDIESMNFDTPHLMSTGTDLAMDHFLSDVEVQEIVENFAELDSAAIELRRMLDQIEAYWIKKQPIEGGEKASWEAARDTFRRPLSRYEELLNDLYFHVLVRVDEYNTIAANANDLYVRVKGVFNVGSPLLPDNMTALPLRRYVPGSWYDTIFYEGYNFGYADAYLRITGNSDGW